MWLGKQLEIGYLHTHTSRNCLKYHPAVINLIVSCQLLRFCNYIKRLLDFLKFILLLSLYVQSNKHNKRKKKHIYSVLSL